MKTFYVYILSNYSNTTIYTGVTNNLTRRVYEHKNHLVDGFTSKYKVNKLVYFEISENINSAIEREKQIKNYSRQKKIEMIESENPNWNDLYDSIVE